LFYLTGAHDSPHADATVLVVKYCPSLFFFVSWLAFSVIFRILAIVAEELDISSELGWPKSSTGAMASLKPTSPDRAVAMNVTRFTPAHRATRK